MKKLLLLLISFTFFTVSCNAQYKKGTKEKIRTYKIAFLTGQLDLTATEAEKFWPIYNAYDKQMMELRYKERVEIKKTIRKKGGVDNFSEAEAKEMIKKMEEISEERHSVKSSFFKKISDIISYQKLLKLEIAEHEFDRKLLRKLRRGRRDKK